MAQGVGCRAVSLRLKGSLGGSSLAKRFKSLGSRAFVYLLLAGCALSRKVETTAERQNDRSCTRLVWDCC